MGGGGGYHFKSKVFYFNLCFGSTLNSLLLTLLAGPQRTFCVIWKGWHTGWQGGGSSWGRSGTQDSTVGLGLALKVEDLRSSSKSVNEQLINSEKFILLYLLDRFWSRRSSSRLTFKPLGSQMELEGVSFGATSPSWTEANPGDASIFTFWPSHHQVPSSCGWRRLLADL